MNELSKTSRERLAGVKSPIIKLIERALAKSPHDFGIPADGGKRSNERQIELYAQGRTKPGNIVTWVDGVKKKSKHQTGMAFDIFVFDEHGACWKCTHKYKEISEVIKAEFNQMQKEGHFCTCESLHWGGDWQKPDMPHFEIR